MANFLASLGCSTTAVLPTIPRETTGHADVVAQFLAADLAIVAWVDPDEEPELAPALDESADHLATAAELAGYDMSVLRVPIATSNEVFYSYVNATRLKNRMLVPSFASQPEQLQRDAYAVLTAAMPDLELVPIQSDSMVSRGGAVHCITLGLGNETALFSPER